jgi:hypothetical protein
VVLRFGADRPDDCNQHPCLHPLSCHIADYDESAARLLPGHYLKEVPPTSRAGRNSLSIANPAILGNSSGIRTCCTCRACSISVFHCSLLRCVCR